MIVVSLYCRETTVPNTAIKRSNFKSALNKMDSEWIESLRYVIAPIRKEILNRSSGPELANLVPHTRSNIHVQCTATTANHYAL